MSRLSKEIPFSDVAGIECRHVIYLPPPKGFNKDYHLAKEVIHRKDGTKTSAIRFHENFKRHYWVTREGYRKHTQKKEWEDIDRLQKFTTTESRMLEDIAKTFRGQKLPEGIKVDLRNPRSMKQINRIPYIYGTDISSSAAVKQEKYRMNWPDLNTPSSIAASDTETDMIHGHKRIVMQTLSMKDKVYTAVVRSFFQGMKDDDIKKRLQEALITYLDQDYEILDDKKKPKKDKDGNQIYGNVYRDRKLKWEIDLVDDDGAVVFRVLQKAHEWMPDFMTFWNMEFDIKKMEESAEYHRMNLADMWSDPHVPAPYRFYEFVQGSAQKVTASGKVTPIPPHARWHTVKTPASFYVIDAMCAYKQVRTGKQEERRYSLDFILNKQINRGKLKFDEGSHLSQAEWHVFMQKHYPIEYTIYNVFDCIGIEMLDEKTKDLCVSVPSGAAMSDYSRFNSQPRRVCDKLHYFNLARNKVMGTTSDEMANEMDEKTISLRDWIVMLPAHLVADNGLKIILEYPELRSNIRLHVGDLDVSASYPNGECVFNISKETTKKELISIEGVSEHTRRMQGINLSGGATNAVEFTTGMFGMPTMVQWLEAYQRHREYGVAIASPTAPVALLDDGSDDSFGYEDEVTDTDYASEEA